MHVLLWHSPRKSGIERSAFEALGLGSGGWVEARLLLVDESESRVASVENILTIECTVRLRKKKWSNQFMLVNCVPGINRRYMIRFKCHDLLAPVHSVFSCSLQHTISTSDCNLLPMG